MHYSNLTLHQVSSIIFCGVETTRSGLRHYFWQTLRNFYFRHVSSYEPPMRRRSSHDGEPRYEKTGWWLLSIIESQLEEAMSKFYDQGGSTGRMRPSITITLSNKLLAPWLGHTRIPGGAGSERQSCIEMIKHCGIKCLTG